MQSMVEAAQAEGDRVEAAALWACSMEEQTDSALNEIENVLIEAGLLTAPKHFGSS